MDGLDKNNNSLIIIVYSCWKNRDMWSIFSKLFQEFWGDCEFKVVLTTDKYESGYVIENSVFDNIIMLDDTWGRMIKTSIEKNDTPYVMLFMDDYLLCDRVNNDDIAMQLERMKKYGAVNFRLVESPRCNGIFDSDGGVGFYKQGEAYSLSTQVGIWNANFLKLIIKDEWSAWDFERIASLESRELGGPILVSLDYVFPYEEGVRKGRWMQSGAKLCKRKGIEIDTSIKPIMNNWEMAKIYLQGAILDVYPKGVIKIQNFLGRIRK